MAAHLVVADHSRLMQGLMLPKQTMYAVYIIGLFAKERAISVCHTTCCL